MVWVASGVIKVRFATAEGGENDPGDQVVPDLLRTGLDVGDHVVESLKEDSLVNGVDQPRVHKGLPGQASIDTDATA